MHYFTNTDFILIFVKSCTFHECWLGIKFSVERQEMDFSTSRLWSVDRSFQQEVPGGSKLTKDILNFSQDYLKSTNMSTRMPLPHYYLIKGFPSMIYIDGMGVP